jgi:DNA-binding NarL/FixJ family response regulator
MSAQQKSERPPEHNRPLHVKRRSPAAAGPREGVGPISVLLVEDHELLRLGTRLMLNAEPDLVVCGEATTEAAARQLAEQLAPALLVVDLSLNDGSGLELIKWATKHHPQTKSIVTTMHDEKIYGERALRAGARGYVSKSAPASALLVAIRQVLAGELYYSEYLRRHALEYLQADRRLPLAAIDRLSDREVQVLRQLGAGATSKEIAVNLHLSVSTVDTYRERVKTKLKLASATALIHFATQWVLEQR